jgi:2-polyprenyl-3-methyl-5-hydroxy-6-metoxy-1,4-benzoquinol methylase
MTVREDPENNEINALRSMVDFTGANVLEIGCGDGRLTWRYAEQAKRVTAIDPFEPSIRRAQENALAQLRDHVKFEAVGFEDFASRSESHAFGVIILSWAL